MKAQSTSSPEDSGVITQAQLDAAILRGAQRPSLPVVSFELVQGEPHKLRFILANGSAIQVGVDLYEEFANLTPEQLGTLYLGCGNQAVCSDELDLHVSLPGLLRAARPSRLGFLAHTGLVVPSLEEFNTPYALYIERLFSGEAD